MKLKDLGRNLAVLTIVTASSLSLYSCKKNEPGQIKNPDNSVKVELVEKKVEEKVEKKNVTLGDVLKYIDKNPEHQELILNYAVDVRNHNVPYSRETVDNLSGIVKQEVEAYPSQMKNYILDIVRIGLRSDCKDEMWGQLTKEEKWQIFKEVSKYKTRECLNETKEVIVDAYDKFKETKLHDKLEDAGERIKEDSKKIYRRVRGKND